MQGGWDLDCVGYPHREAVAVSGKKDEFVSAVNLQWKLCMQEGVCLDGCMFVLM